MMEHLLLLPAEISKASRYAQIIRVITTRHLSEQGC